MSITISLSPEEERRLRERAARAGRDVAAYVRQLIEREIHGVSEALAAFRHEVVKSGISDEELRVFFEEVREQVWQEKHGKPNGMS
ncbi:MAG: hypothetical protein WBX00_08805 [Isosphaeraceae bacterium]|jgi:predicted DNA-binding protein